MIKDIKSDRDPRTSKSNIYREKLLAELPVVENQYLLAGVPTTVLIGGNGTPLILLHGPGESSFWWMRVIPELAKTHKVIAPDLPGHGASGLAKENLTAEHVLAWLAALIDHTCPEPPILVGHILGGAIAARFAIKHGERLKRLVLVDSLGLGPFRPAPMLAFELFRFILGPNEKSYNRFLPYCMYDVDKLRREMGAYWEPFLAYNLLSARHPEGKTALRTLMQKTGIPQIPKEELSKISVPVALIWGRHDRANKLRIASKASTAYGWPLHIIENSGDDPKLEKPKNFLNALEDSINYSLIMEN